MDFYVITPDMMLFVLVQNVDVFLISSQKHNLLVLTRIASAT